MEVYLGMGSNLGRREINLALALELLDAAGAHPLAVSSVYETEPVGILRQGRFLNMVCKASTALDPQGLLMAAKGVEWLLGRGPGQPGGPRPIDVDVLLCDGLVVEGPGLRVPHPGLESRAFVLAPLVELAPGLVCPVSGRAAAELLREAPDREGVRHWGRLARSAGAGVTGGWGAAGWG